MIKKSKKIGIKKVELEKKEDKINRDRWIVSFTFVHNKYNIKT